MKELSILFEHPQWQEPLFEMLTKKGVSFRKVDLKKGARADDLPVENAIYFSQASPSAYLRDHTHAVPWALTLMEVLEADGAKVLNGSKAFRFELNKALQARVLHHAGIDHPKTFAFNSVESLDGAELGFDFPAILKPNQGGSGARMYKVESLDEVKTILTGDPTLWRPDYVMLLQEYLPHDHVVRMEFLGGELLYAMKVFSEGDVFNLCPSEVCNPGDGTDGACAVDLSAPAPPVFEPFPEVPAAAVEVGKKICELGGLDVSGIEYLETPDGRRVFYDINANSNLRKPIGEHFGFDPFERVADFLISKMATS